MYLELVVWEVGYGEGLHVCCRIGQQEDCHRCAQVLYYRSKSGCSMPRDSHGNIRDGMVKAEVGVRHEVQWDWHLQGHISLHADTSSCRLVRCLASGCNNASLTCGAHTHTSVTEERALTL